MASSEKYFQSSLWVNCHSEISVTHLKCHNIKYLDFVLGHFFSITVIFFSLWHTSEKSFVPTTWKWSEHEQNRTLMCWSEKRLWSAKQAIVCEILTISDRWVLGHRPTLCLYSSQNRGSPFYGTLNIDKVVNASADKMRRKEKQWLTVCVASAKLFQSEHLSLNLWSFCKFFEEDIEIPAAHKSTESLVSYCGCWWP